MQSRILLHSCHLILDFDPLKLARDLLKVVAVSPRKLLKMLANGSPEWSHTSAAKPCMRRTQRDHCPSLTFVVCLCPPADRWFFSNVNLYLHHRRLQWVTGIHLVIAGATASLGLSQFCLESEKRTVVTVLLVLHYCI